MVQKILKPQKAQKIVFNAGDAALSLGLLAAALHVIGIALVAGTGGGIIGWAQSLHFVTVSYHVAALDAVTAVVGIIAAFASGAVTGALFAVIWNAVTK